MQVEESLVSDEEVELEKYLSTNITLGENEDPLQFWTSQTLPLQISHQQQKRF